MAKVKQETQEQKLKREEKEAKELAKWEKELTKKRSSFYFGYLMLVLSIAYMADEISSQINTQMQSEIAIGLFQNRMSLMGMLNMLSVPIIICVVFYRALSDKYGRKIFLCINTLGMGTGLFLIFLAGKISGMSGIVMYLVASTMISFFIPNDTQVIYIMETAQAGKRGTLVASVKFLASISVMLIPIMRSVFMGNDQTRWFYVYLVPALLAVTASVLCFIGLREPETFIQNRIKYLKTPYEERNISKKADGASEGGIGTAFRFVAKHKQLRWLFIVATIWGLGAFGIQYYSRIMANYYSTEEVTTALLMYPITSAIITLLNGVIGDKAGRKKLVVVMAITSFLSFAILFVSCNLHWNPVIAGLMVGVYIGSFYAVGDNIGTYMTGESAPTSIRASVMSALSMVNIVSKMLAMFVPIIALAVTGDNYQVLGWLCMLGSLPMMLFAILFITTKVGDTSHVDLNTVRGDEWD